MKDEKIENLEGVSSSKKEVTKNKKSNEANNTFSVVEVSIIILCTCVVSIIFGIAIGHTDENKYSDSLNELINNYQYIVNSYYGEVDEEKLVDAAINGIVSELGDDYSSYFTEDDNDSFNKVMTGSYEGIGIQVGQYTTGEKVVLNVFEGSSASEAGIQVLDVLVSVDGKSLEGLATSDVVSIINASKNKNIDITVLRGEEEVTVTVERKEVVIKSVEYDILEKNDQKVGYIYVSVFSLNTYEQFKEALEELEKTTSSIIIDVRGNGGGHLTSVEKMISLFLDSSNIIYKMDIDGKVTSYYSTGSVTKTYPVSILINGQSASASELLTISLREQYGAKVIGEPSFGKGTVQEKYNLSTGSSYKVTTKKWLSPNGVNLSSENKIIPDIEIASGEGWAPSTYEEDVQLQAALDDITSR